MQDKISKFLVNLLSSETSGAIVKAPQSPQSPTKRIDVRSFDLWMHRMFGTKIPDLPRDTTFPSFGLASPTAADSHVGSSDFQDTPAPMQYFPPITLSKPIVQENKYFGAAHPYYDVDKLRLSPDYRDKAEDHFFVFDTRNKDFIQREQKTVSTPSSPPAINNSFNLRTSASPIQTSSYRDLRASTSSLQSFRRL
jgi:hypothetical protein